MTQAILYGSYPEVRLVAHRMGHYSLTRLRTLCISAFLQKLTKKVLCPVQRF
jgi:hypothetical protein